MHHVFIAYGMRSEVELLLRDMEANKHWLKMWKGKGKKRKEKKILIQGQVRLLPFGVLEYVCPKEDSDIVLNTLNFSKERYNLGKLRYKILRTLTKCDKIPEYKTNLNYPWITDNVNIIPLGTREDPIHIDADGEHKGWEHEAI